MQRIVIPVDFSPSSLIAAHYALMLAKNQKSFVEVVLINVYFVRQELVLVVSDKNIKKLLRQEVLDLTLVDLLKNLPMNISIKGLIKKGNVASTILDEVKNLHADLLVISRRRVNLTFYSPIAKQLISKTDVSVMIIPELNNFVTIPETVAILLEENSLFSDESLDMIFKIVNQFNSEIILIYPCNQYPNTDINNKTLLKIAQKGYMFNIIRSNIDEINKKILSLSDKDSPELICMTTEYFMKLEKKVCNDDDLFINHIPVMVLNN
jgi:nucleotide-binding universal stress UspA family protein